VHGRADRHAPVLANSACSKSPLAIACRPRVLLLDEPGRRRARRRAARHSRRGRGVAKDVTVLLIEHDMDIVFSFADRISVLVNGTLFVGKARPTRSPPIRA